MLARRALALLGLWLTSGCSALLQLEGGHQRPTGDAEGRAGAGVNLHLGVGFSDAPAGVDVGFRTKFSERASQFALSGGLYAFTPPSVVGAYGRAGLHLIQLESIDERFQAGALGPFAELGLMIYPSALGATSRAAAAVARRGGPFFSLSGIVEYNVRFTSAPSSGVVGFMAGLGVAGFGGRR
jgi:hypothetical protein